MLYTYPVSLYNFASDSNRYRDVNQVSASHLVTAVLLREVSEVVVYQIGFRLVNSRGAIQHFTKSRMPLLTYVTELVRKSCFMCQINSHDLI